MSRKLGTSKQSKESTETVLSDDERVELVANLILDIISEEQEKLLGGTNG